MSSIVRSLAAMLVATLLGSVSLAQEVVENPQYQAWTKFKPGTWVIVSHEIQMGEQARKEPLRIKSKLVAVTAEQVVLEGTGLILSENPPICGRSLRKSLGGLSRSYENGKRT